MTTQVRCDSGLLGWHGKLRDNYLDFPEFVVYCDRYHLHRRLGYDTPAAAWVENPLVQGSTRPEDFRKATDGNLLATARNKPLG
jgi:hypothetical protein